MKIIIAIPAHNEEQLLQNSITRLTEFCTSHLSSGIDWQIIIADNASTDATAQIGRQLDSQLPRVKYLSLSQKGKGYAIRSAWEAADADIYAFMDADLATGLEALPSLIEAIAQGADLAVGSRFHAKSKVKRNWLRFVISYGYRALAQIFISTKVRDLSCGFKAISHKVKQEILPLVKDQAWFFDSELTVLAEDKGFKVKQIPVTWEEHRHQKNASRVKLVSLSLSYLKQLIVLRKRLAPRQKIKKSSLVKPAWLVVLAIILTVVNVLVNDEAQFARENLAIFINFNFSQIAYLIFYLVKMVFLLWLIFFGFYYLAYQVIKKLKWRIWPEVLVIPFILILLARSVILEPYLYKGFYSQSLIIQKVIDGLLYFDLKLILDIVVMAVLLIAFWIWLGRRSWIPISILFFVIIFPNLQYLKLVSQAASAQETLLVIVVDSLRRDYVEQNSDLFINDIIADSVVLERMYTPNPASVPAVAAIFSGQYPYQSRGTFIFLDKPLDLSLVNQLNKRYGLYFVSDFAVDEIINRQNFNIAFDQSYVPRIDFETHIMAYLLRSNVVLMSMIDPQYRNLVIPEFYRTDISNSRKIINRTVQLLDSRRNQPKIVFMSESDLHIPLHAQYPYYRPYRSTAPNRFKWKWGYADFTYRGEDSVANESLRNLYAQRIEVLDDNLEYLFNQLKQRNLLDNTTIVLTADHGESLYDNNLLLNGHNNIDSRHVLNVPFYMYNTGLPARRDTENTYILNDTLSIALDPENAASYGQTTVYIENDIDWVTIDHPLMEVYTLINYNNIIINDLEKWHRYKNRAVISGHYQLSYHPIEDDPYALYDIDADPLYQKDIKEEFPELFSKLKQQLDEFIQDTKKY